jgi:anti-sigma factor RsiW
MVETVAHLSMELIERYALRELSEIEIQQVVRHVAKCPECEDRLQEQVDSWAAMRSWSVAMVRKIVKAERKRPAKG